MTKFIIIFLLFLFGIHEAWLEQSKVYLLFTACLIVLSFCIYVLWYFVYYRPYSKDLKRLEEILEFIEANFLIPEITNYSGSVLQRSELNGRSVFCFKGLSYLFSSLFKYGDNGGSCLRLKDQGKAFKLVMGQRCGDYDNTFVAWDTAYPEQSDFRLLKKYVHDLCLIFDTEMSGDAVEIVKKLFFHLTITVSNLFGHSRQRNLDILLRDLFDVIREIELAVSDTDCKVKDGLNWFELRLKLTGAFLNQERDDSFAKYRDEYRPEKIAEDIVAQLEGMMKFGGDILFVNYPSWKEFYKPINNYLASHPEIRVHVADNLLTIHHATLEKDSENNYVLLLNERVQKECMYDLVFCFNLMQHCSKAKSKAYYRKLSGVLKDNGVLMLIAAVSRDPKIDTFVGECIPDRVMMYLDEEINLDNNILCIQTPEGNLSLRMQELRCNDGKKSALAKNIYLSSDEATQNNVYCGSLLYVASRGRKMMLSLVRDNYVFSHCKDRFQNVSPYLVATGEECKFESIKLKIEGNCAYLNFDIEPDVALQMIKVDSVKSDDSESLLEKAVKALSMKFPPILFEDCPEVYCNYLLNRNTGHFDEQFFKAAFTVHNQEDEKEKIELTFFLPKLLKFDLEGYILVKYGNDIFATFYPGKKLLSEEDFYKVSNFSADNVGISATHQISWKTLKYRLKQIGCEPELVKFHSLGPLASLSQFAKRCNLEQKKDENRYELLSQRFQKLNLKQQLELLDELDVHDILIVARKRKKEKKIQVVSWRME